MAAKKKGGQETVSSEVTRWLQCFSDYDKVAAKWESRAQKVVDRYRDSEPATVRNTASSKFNILWSNVQTLSAATFAKLPKPDVSRRFRDNDPVGRVASLLLERGLDYEIQHYSDYRYAMKAVVQDRFLPGRGTAWVRYEPHFKAIEEDLPQDGVQVTEDTDEPNEQIDYECAPMDYVHWRDFGHTVARTWDEVTAVWRKVYMTRDALIARFGEDEGAKIPLDSMPEELKGGDKPGVEDAKRGLIYEIWDKPTKRAIWLSKSLGKIVDERDDPLELEEFFPCPKPLFATLTNDSLEPVPDFVLYQDQARELDTLCDRIDGLVKALQVKGCYDASIPALGRLFSEGDNTSLVPVTNWGAFAEKQGLKGAIDILELKPIYEALQACYVAMEQIKQQIYEITGISDIVRGQGDADATATAERIKGQYASLRLKAYQEEVAQFAAEALQIKAQIICNKFAPETILAISAADQLSEFDKRLVPQAMQLLIGDRLVMPEAHTKNPMRSFRIEIESDSLVYLDDQENKKARMEFLTAQGQFIMAMEKTMMAAGPMAAPLMPALMEMWKFSAQAFKVGKNIEGSIDEAAEKMKQLAAQPQHGIPPQVQQQMEAAQKQLQDGAKQLQAEKAKIEGERQAVEGEKQKLFADKTKADVERIQLNADRQVFELQRKTTEESIKNREAVKAHGEKAQAEVQSLQEQSLKREQQITEQAGSEVAAALSQIQSTLDEIQAMQARLMQVEKQQNAIIEREIVAMERVKGADGFTKSIRRKHANGEVSEVAVN